jgi:Tfp pilus assembly protein PilO
MVDKIKEILEKLKWSYVVAIIVAGGAFFTWSLDRTEIEMREQSIVDTDNEIRNLEKKIQDAKEFEKQYEEKRKRFKQLSDELQKLQGALPRQFFLPDLLSDLLREAKQLEIEITSIKPDAKEEQKELYNSLGFSINARGTFLQFFIFLDRMANLKRLVSVDKFEVLKDPERSLVTLGGEEGVFSGTKLGGGRASYPGIRATLRVITYRYKGAVGGGGN